MEKLKYDDVFVPNDQPIYTYIPRDSKKLEIDLRDHIDTKNIVISISGPSKTGKTVLFRQMLDHDLIIPIPGVSVKDEGDFWSSVFAWMGEPISVVRTNTSTVAGELSANGKAGFNAVIAKAGVGGGAKISYARQTGEAMHLSFNPFEQIIKEIGNSKFVIFVDDFHYIDSDTQPQIARILKALAENGVKICTASVPHKSDDVVRANPELRGRLAAIDVESWSQEELAEIGRVGFPLLKVDVDDSINTRLASEAFGSPQLMQALCMNLCRNLNVRTELDFMTKFEVSEEVFASTMEDTSKLANFASLVRGLHDGPKKHGKDRKIFSFSDGSRGDVYRATLLAISRGDAKRDFSYDEFMGRVRNICLGEAPTGSSVQGALSHMHNIAHEMSTSPVLDWEEDNLTITDPYFAFYLRASRQLEKIKRTDQ